MQARRKPHKIQKSKKQRITAIHHRQGRTDNYAHYVALRPRPLSLIHPLAILATLHLRLTLKPVPSFTCFCGELASCGECRKWLKRPPPLSSHTIRVIVLCARTSGDPSRFHGPSARAYLSRRVPAFGTTALTSRPFNFTAKCTLTLHFLLSCISFLSCPFVTFDILGLRRGARPAPFK